MRRFCILLMALALFCAPIPVGAFDIIQSAPAEVLRRAEARHATVFADLGLELLLSGGGDAVLAHLTAMA